MLAPIFLCKKSVAYFATPPFPTKARLLRKPCLSNTKGVARFLFLQFKVFLYKYIEKDFFLWYNKKDWINIILNKKLNIKRGNYETKKVTVLK